MSSVLPPPIPTTASKKPERRRPRSSVAASTEPPSTIQMSAFSSCGRSTSAISSPCPGPTAIADVAAAGDAAVGEQRREPGDRAGADVDGQGHPDHPAQQRHATSRALSRSTLVVDLDPLEAAHGRDADAPAAVGVLLEAVLVVQRRVALPGRLERLREPLGGGRLDQRQADVLARGLGGVVRLVDAAQQAVAVEQDLHLLLAERLGVVERQHELGVPAPRQQPLLDLGRVHRVAVAEQHAAREVLARAPQRVGVVPLLGLRVEDGLDRDAVALLERRPALLDALGRVAGDDHDLLQPRAAQVAERDVEDRAVAVDRQQRLGKVFRQRLEPPPGPRREHHADQSASSSSSS